MRAPLLTTVMQVASRFLLVWGIANQFPRVARSSPAYSTMLLAWSTTEVIRYSYFAVNLAYGYVPAALTWLRYNTFFVLYPLGISSECWLLYLATGPASKRMQGLQWALWAVLAVYVPGERTRLAMQDDLLLTLRRLLHPVHAYDGPTTESYAELAGRLC